VPGSALFAPATIPLAATATDSDGSVTQVTFYSGTTPIGAGVLNGTSYVLNWSNVPAGTYHLTARATDNAGASGSSANVDVTVAPPPPTNAPPAVSLTSPLQNSTFEAPATILLQATATDSDGSVTQVTFYSGTTALGAGVLNGTSYVLNWLNVPVGTYHLTARAIDNAGASGSSATVDVTVAAPPTTNAAPAVSLTSPIQNSTFQAPATIPLQATATDSDGSIAQVAFYSGSSLLGNGTASGSVYTFNWTGVPAGTYHVTARATDNGASSATSAIIDFSVNNPAPPPAGGATAAFVRLDSTTQGNWRGALGRDGYLLANEGSRVPAYAQVAIANQQSWTWDSSTTSLPALQKSSGTDRIAACWFTASVFSIDVNLSDGAVHQVAVYGLDWDYVGRGEKVDIVDVATGAVLDTRQLSGFMTGQYLVWRLSGHVSIRITRTASNSAALSGIFFDPSSTGGGTPAVTMLGPSAPASFTAGASIPLSADANEVGGSISQVSFYTGNTLIGVSTSVSSPYTLLWQNAAAGTHTVTARATDTAAVSASSPPITIAVTVPSGGGGTTTATFLRTDDTTLGSWKGTYGVDGYNIANESVSAPVYAQVALSGQSAWTWEPSAIDTRALQKGGSATGRIAACWYSGATFSIDVNITDGAPHQMAIYGIDWDWVGRSETIEIVNAATGAVLDTRTFAGFQGGRFWIWRVSGHVTLRITRVGPGSAALSGLFFDPAP
jgi:hypothetical protein